jgi:hypothetical protein
MSGSTSFGKKGRAAIDPAAVAKVSPDSSADEIHIPTGKDKQEKKKKKKKKKKGQEEGNGKGEAKAETDAAGGSQVSPRHVIQKSVPLKLAQ